MRTSKYKFEREYYTYDRNSFISDVGGNLGLFLGMSILSLYDLGCKLLKRAHEKIIKVFGGGEARKPRRSKVV